MIDWHNRYAKLLRENPEVSDAERSVLEVGPGSWGIALWTQRPVVGVEPRWESPGHPLMEQVSAQVWAPPFDDAAFDYVVCLEVLEHVRLHGEHEAGTGAGLGGGGRGRSS